MDYCAQAVYISLKCDQSTKINKFYIFIYLFIYTDTHIQRSRTCHFVFFFSHASKFIQVYNLKIVTVKIILGSTKHNFLHTVGSSFSQDGRHSKGSGRQHCKLVFTSLIITCVYLPFTQGYFSLILNYYGNIFK